MIIRTCETCRNEFKAKPYLVRLGYAKNCSMPCYWKSKIGKTMRNKGRRLSPDHVAKLSGKNANNWQGGISSENEKFRKSADYILWRTAVFMRDNYTCRECLTKGGKLHADHIKPFSLYPELRLAIDNGRTLCENCHKQTDTYGGRMHKWL